VTTMKLDAGEVNAAATGLDAAASAVPTGIALDMGSCGSSQASAAAESFNMWARLTGEILAQRLHTAASDARTGVTTMGDADQAIAFAAREG
jgi:hypothetical protein